MNKAVAALALSIAVAIPVQAALQSGAKAPDFSAPASLAGKEFKFSLKDALAKGPVVVYFYPSAYTGGCNLQAHTFSVEKEKFDAAHATIIGVSLDNIARLNAFSADPEYCAGKIAVASDADGAIAKSYELKIVAGSADQKDSRGQPIGHDFAERTTFIVKPDGTIAATVGGVKPADNVAQALAAVQGLAAK